MNKKVIIGICLTIIILSLSLNPIVAIDSSNWKEITIEGVNFKIPPQYQSGELVGDTYMLETVFDFSIASVNNNSSLKEIYGYESTIEELNNLELKEVGGHDTVILHSYRSVCQHNVSYVFFAVRKSIYTISFNGNKITSEIEEIIKNTPESKISKDELYKKLDKAQEDYVQEQIDYDEAYEYSESYREGYYEGAKDMKSQSPSFVDYYCAYRITNYLMK